MPRENTPCGNPIFLSWVQGESPSYHSHHSAFKAEETWPDVCQELRDKARERGTKAAETYQKACNSLERCPVSYPRPRDLVCLNGIGPKTVGILEAKWKKHCEENELPLSVSLDNESFPALKYKEADRVRDGEGKVQSRSYHRFELRIR